MNHLKVIILQQILNTRTFKYMRVDTKALYSDFSVKLSSQADSVLVFNGSQVFKQQGARL